MDREPVYTPDVLNASFQPDDQILINIREQLLDDPHLLDEGCESNEFNQVAVEKYLEQEVETHGAFYGDAYRIGGRLMNLIVERTYEKDGGKIPQIIPQHFALNRGVDQELAIRMPHDSTVLDFRMVEWDIMKAEMPAFARVPLIPDEASNYGRQAIAGIVDIANLYDVAAKNPPAVFIAPK